MARGPLVALVLALLLSAPVARAADDPAKLAEAKKMVADMAAARKAKDVAALQALLGKLAAIHNGITDKSTRSKLLKEAGDVLKGRDLESLAEPTVEALAQCDDPKGAFKHLRRYMPGPKDKNEVTPLGLKVIEAAGTLAPNEAIKPLQDLASKSRDYKAAAAAIASLGKFKGSKKRVGILEELVKLMRLFRPPNTGQVGKETADRWKALAEPLVVACNELTGQKLKSPDDWVNVWNENKHKPAAIFQD
jgi:hypothetical protein